MRIYTSIAGAYPRVGINSIGHELRNARHKYDKGLISIEQISKLEDELVREVINEQEQAGMDLITDGLVRWYCPVSHIAGRMSGVEKGELHHYFKTNFHIRKAIIKRLPRWKEPLIKKEVEFLRKNSKKDILAILPDVSILMKYTDNPSSFSSKEIKRSYETALAKEVESINAPIYVEGGKNNFQIVEAVSAFSAKEEKPKEVIQRIRRQINWKSQKPVLLKPNWWLDILPRHYAYRKMQILSEIKNLLLQ